MTDSICEDSSKLSVRGLVKRFDGKETLHKVVRSRARDIPAIQKNHSFVRLQQSDEDAQRRRLSASGRPQDGQELTFTHIESEVVMGIVFQNYALFENMTVLGNVEYALKFKPELRGDRRAIATSVLEQIGLIDLMDRGVRDLSGGQQQRVCIARTLALNPKIILFDEPMSALDVEARLSLRAELKRIQGEFGTTMIYITHDQEEAFALSDRIMVMGGGRIHQLADPEEIIANPADDYVSEFVVRNLRIKMDSLARFMGR